jgi:hypothetical protein
MLEKPLYFEIYQFQCLVFSASTSRATNQKVSASLQLLKKAIFRERSAIDKPVQFRFNLEKRPGLALIFCAYKCYAQLH